MSLGSKFNPLGGVNYWDEKHYSFEASIPSDNYTFTLKVATSDKAYTMDATDVYINSVTVNWGDGTTEEYSSGDMTHVYTTQGNYKITILSTPGNMPYFTCSPTGVILRILTPLLTCYTGDKPRKTFDGFLQDESNCRSLPKKFFSKNPQITSMNSTFYYYGWYGQMYMPADLFHYTPNVTDMESLLEYARFQILPDGIFDKCTEVTTFARALSTFYGINAMSSNIFDNCTKVTDFSECFNGGIHAGLTLPRLWERTNVTNYSDCFLRASSASNYVEVPYNWGGPSRVTFNVTPSDATIECSTSYSYSKILKVEGTTYLGDSHYYGFKYKISKDGYVPQEGTVEAGDNTLDIVLEERNITVTVNTSIEGMKVLLTAYNETIEGNSIKVGKGATVAWETVSDYYGSKSGTIPDIQEDTTEEVQYTDKVTLYTTNTNGLSDETTRALYDVFSTTGPDFTSGVMNQDYINDSFSESFWTAYKDSQTGCTVIDPIDQDNLVAHIGITCMCNQATSWVAGFHFGKTNYPLTTDLVKTSTPSDDGQFLATYVTTSQNERVYDSKSALVTLERNTTYYLNMFNGLTAESWMDSSYMVGINYIDILIDKPDDWEQYSLKFHGCPSKATITLKYKGIEHTFVGDNNGTMISYDKGIDKNTLVYYNIVMDGYYPFDGWVRMSMDRTIQVDLCPFKEFEYVYPFNTFVSPNDKNSLGLGGGISAVNDSLKALVSEDSYHKAYGSSQWELSRSITSRSVNPINVRFEVDAYVSSQKNGDYGCITIGSNAGAPSVSDMKNGNNGAGWIYVMCQSGTDNKLQTYNIEWDIMSAVNKLSAVSDTIGERIKSVTATVHLSFCYAKNLLTNSGEDRLIVSRIKMYPIEE